MRIEPLTADSPYLETASDVLAETFSKEYLFQAIIGDATNGDEIAARRYRHTVTHAVLDLEAWVAIEDDVPGDTEGTSRGHEVYGLMLVKNPGIDIHSTYVDVRCGDHTNSRPNATTEHKRAADIIAAPEVLAGVKEVRLTYTQVALTFVVDNNRGPARKAYMGRQGPERHLLSPLPLHFPRRERKGRRAQVAHAAHGEGRKGGYGDWTDYAYTGKCGSRHPPSICLGWAEEIRQGSCAELSSLSHPAPRLTQLTPGQILRTIRFPCSRDVDGQDSWRAVPLLVDEQALMALRAEA